jgi:feruloyl esterase
MRPSVVLPLALATLAAARPAAAGTPRHRPTAADCAALATAAVPDVRITDATPVPANPKGRGATVAHCRVRGVIGLETRFELLLPDEWNRKFFMGGGGGFVGSVENMAVRSVNEGYATSGTDAGHVSSPINAEWAVGHPDRVLDYAWRAVHRTAEVSKALIARYYGQAPEKSYFFGCSNGGREALMEAQRFPTDFDGIVAFAPAADFTATAARFLASFQALYPTADVTRPTVTRDNLALISRMVRTTCDAQDGVSDGTLEDPRQCTFALSQVPPCPGDVPGAECLTTAQRRALTVITTPLVIGGRTVYPGQPWGDEADPAGWGLWITDVNPQFLGATRQRAPSLQAAFGAGVVGALALNDSTLDPRTYDLSRWATDGRALAPVLDANNPDLDAFRKRGGKLILAHGWSDPALNARATIAYHDAVLARDRSAARDVRLFLLPGVVHCAGGSGCDQVNWFGAIADWVERGQAPETLVARKDAPPAAAGATPAPARSHLLCAYPKRAVLNGTGAGNDAGHYRCAP